SPVDLAGGQTVAEHLRHIFSRHLHTYDPFAGGAVIRPILKVVAVAALVVEPGGAVSMFLPLGVVWAVIPLEVFRPGKELHRGVLGQVMGQALPVQPQAEA
ncbi:Cell division protein FtsL, partial [Dysosmobacter welbionis]